MHIEPGVFTMRGALLRGGRSRPWVRWFFSPFAGAPWPFGKIEVTREYVRWGSALRGDIREDKERVRVVHEDVLGFAIDSVVSMSVFSAVDPRGRRRGTAFCTSERRRLTQALETYGWQIVQPDLP